MDIPTRTVILAVGNGEFLTVRDFAANVAVFHCPTTSPSTYDRATGTNWMLGNYGANNRIISASSTSYNMLGISGAAISNPSRTVLLADRYSGRGSRAATDEKNVGGPILGTTAPYPVKTDGPTANHRGDRNPTADPLGAGPCNFLFCDGHVETIQLQSLRPFPDSAGTPSNITFIP